MSSTTPITTADLQESYRRAGIWRQGWSFARAVATPVMRTALTLAARARARRRLSPAQGRLDLEDNTMQEYRVRLHFRDGTTWTSTETAASIPAAIESAERYARASGYCLPVMKRFCTPIVQGPLVVS
jgi:hypothetical protein